MPKINEKSAGYNESERPDPVPNPVPIPAPGIGTRIGDTAKVLGTRKTAAFVMGVSPDALARYIREENVPAFDVAARLCLTAGRSMEWLATGIGQAKTSRSQAASQDLSGESLMVSAELADEALKGLWLPKHRYFDLVALVLEGVTQGLPYAEIIEMIRPVAENMAKERGGDDGRSGLGGAGQGGAGGRKAGARLP